MNAASNLTALRSAFDSAIKARRNSTPTRESHDRINSTASWVVDVVGRILPELERLASDARVEGAEAELGAVRRWLRDHQGYTMGFALKALDARDHHSNGGTPDATAIELRVDILDELQSCWPEHRTAAELELALEYMGASELEPHLAALVAAGFLEERRDQDGGSPAWTTVPEVADQCVDAGWRVLAARSVGR